jgi:outer membrane protein assembly factor BamB
MEIRMSFRGRTALALCMLLTPGLAAAGDWPQILGPHRNGVAVDETLLAAWPTQGPDVVWENKVGQGYAGPAVVGDRVILFDRVGDVERVQALSTTDGRQLWLTEFAATYRGGVNPDLGPRCVPLTHAGAVYLFGAAGDLYCIDLATGETNWSRNLFADYNGDEGYFGAGSTPIIVGDRLLVNIGGRDGHGLAAISLETGKTIWIATDERASYSAPALASIDGKPVAWFVTRMNAVAINPVDGDVLFRIPFGKRGPTVNAATPLLIGERLFLTASYRVGAVLASFTGKQVETVWSSDEVLSSQYTTPVHHAGYLYGTHGREDIGVAELRCVETATGRVVWRQASFGVAHLILAGDKLLIAKCDGSLVLAEANPAGFQQLASTRLFKNTARNIPALSSGRFYSRSNSGAAGVLKCVRVGE